MLAANVKAQDEWQSLYEPATIEDSKLGELKYRWMKPEGLQAEDKTLKYPLVMFLHGAGERGDDNQAQLKHCAVEFTKPLQRKQHPSFVVFPQCPQNEKWAEVDWSRREIDFAEEPGRVMALVFKLVDELAEKYPIDRERLYVGGLSMGGYGTWHAVGLKPKMWAAAIPICGGADLSWSERIKETPVWTFHGDADRAVPVENTRQIVADCKGQTHP